jgi:hypothetical protein
VIFAMLSNNSSSVADHNGSIPNDVGTTIFITLENWRYYDHVVFFRVLILIKLFLKLKIRKCLKILTASKNFVVGPFSALSAN